MRIEAPRVVADREDSLPPEQNDHFKHIRNHSTVPIAMGELFVNVHEYVPQ